MKFEIFQLTFPEGQNTLTDYNQYIKAKREEIDAKHQEEEVGVSEANALLWKQLENCDTPHESLVQLFTDSAKAIDIYFQQLSNVCDIKRCIKIFNKLSNELKKYEATSLQHTTNKLFHGYIVFEKLYTLRNPSSKNPNHDTDCTKWYNDIVKQTGDVYRKYFTSIPGLREEINTMLLNNYSNYLNTEKGFHNFKKRSAAFGTHHFFAMYAKKIQQYEFASSLNLLKQHQKTGAQQWKRQRVTCVCGCKTDRGNLAIHMKTALHKKIVEALENVKTENVKTETETQKNLQTD
jgi:hypothetical protein